jgi:predicted secreted protein
MNFPTVNTGQYSQDLGQPTIVRINKDGNTIAHNSNFTTGTSAGYTYLYTPESYLSVCL